MNTRHLDIGCGGKARNPYKADKLYGVDIMESVENPCVDEYASANLAVENIPFEDDFFDSVSAYDFLEHVPRSLYLPEQGKMRLPFVELMNEIWRVLKNNGLFYASTPCYPYQEAFVDPTHVNYITEKSHIYFTRPDLMGAAYGFTGCFEAIRVKRIKPRYEYEPNVMTLKQNIKKIEDILKNRNTHLLWEFRAIKQREGATPGAWDPT
ncbi:MAG: class I SAM-dependent methyltransferase [Deltaproteobacteria bacterium]|nr:class I SAM-dependent methyltransferase [Deltaproteobacteria bacterium]